MLVTLLAWIVLGAIAGYIASFIAGGVRGLGVVGHIVLGIVGALAGGFLANALGYGTGRAGGDIINVQSVVVAVIGALVLILLIRLLSGRRSWR